MNETSVVPSHLERREFLSVGAGAIAAAVLGNSGEIGRADGAPSTRGRPDALDDVVALTFDVFGTVVDWRTSIVREGQQLSRAKGIELNWEEFADRWRGGYGPGMNRVRTGALPWMKIDRLHRMILDELLLEFGISGLAEAEIDHLNRAWHRLMPWSDTVSGLNRLRSKFLLVTLSNGNVSLLANMAKNAGLPWDVILSAELSDHFKPDPEVYLKASELLDLPPNRIMMVAAHKGDLRASQALGFRTAFVPRPLERGPGVEIDSAPDPQFDIFATDFVDLARRLGA